MKIPAHGIVSCTVLTNRTSHGYDVTIEIRALDIESHLYGVAQAIDDDATNEDAAKAVAWIHLSRAIKGLGLDVDAMIQDLPQSIEDERG